MNIVFFIFTWRPRQWTNLRPTNSILSTTQISKSYANVVNIETKSPPYCGICSNVMNLPRQNMIVWSPNVNHTTNNMNKNYYQSNNIINHYETKKHMETWKRENMETWKRGEWRITPHLSIFNLSIFQFSSYQSFNSLIF